MASLGTRLTRNHRPGAAGASAAQRADLTFVVEADLTKVQSEWKSFESRSTGTLYQNALWCRAWIETVGAAAGIMPRIVIGRDNGGQILFILPLQIRRRQGIRVLEWLGSPHHNYGYGLFEPAFMVQAEDWFTSNWDSIAAEIGGFDAIALTEMPATLFGRRHPLSSIFNLRGANPSFAMALDADFDALHSRKRSAERRRSARKHEAGLAQTGQVRFGLSGSKSELHALIDTMFSHQEGRLAELGVHGVFGPSERQFIHRLAALQDETSPILAPYHLSCDGEVLAVMLGGLHANGYWALISSLAPGPRRKYSPGDLALRRTIAACCERGLTFFDFSAGDAPYKRQWADETVEVFASMRAVNLRGLLWSSIMSMRVAMKRTIKRSSALRSVSLAIRRSLFGRSARR